MRYLVYVLVLLTLIPHLLSKPVTEHIVNTYSSVVEVRVCRNWMRIDTTYSAHLPNSISTGDTVYIIQMKGARADSNGNIVDMGKAGRFERNVVEKRLADTLFFRYTLLTNYDAGGTVQIVRQAGPDKHELSTVADASKRMLITAPPFNGRTGGVVAVYSPTTLFLNGTISADACGFAPGDGITDRMHSGNAGRGAPQSSGGGGHGGTGGTGQRIAPEPYAPAGGNALSYEQGFNWLFLGGGSGICSECSQTLQGGRGGGIVIVDAPEVQSLYFQSSVTANGQSVSSGAAGAGAGGAVLMSALSISNTDLSAAGGSCLRGGAGGGGVVRIGTITSMNLTPSAYSGGLASANPAGTAQAGKVYYNVTINESRTRFQTPTIYASTDTLVCLGGAVTLYAHGGESTVWLSGLDTLCARCDTVVVSPRETTTFTALVSVYGCADTVHTTVSVVPPPVIDMPDTVVTCSGIPVELRGPDGMMHYDWSTGSTTQNIDAEREGWVWLTVTDSNTCTSSDSTFIRFQERTRIMATGPLNGDRIQLPSVLPNELSSAFLVVRNITDDSIQNVAVHLTNNTTISVALHTIGGSIPPGDSLILTLVGSSSVPGLYTDTVILTEPCGETIVPVSVVVHETPSFTRCAVRITNPGEFDDMLQALGSDVEISDVLGRQVHRHHMAKGIYLVRGRGFTMIVQMP